MATIDAIIDHIKKLTKDQTDAQADVEMAKAHLHRIEGALGAYQSVAALLETKDRHAEPRVGTV